EQFGTPDYAYRDINPPELPAGQAPQPGSRLRDEPDCPDYLVRVARVGEVCAELAHDLAHRQLPGGDLGLRDYSDPPSPGAAGRGGVGAQHADFAAVPAPVTFEDLDCRGLAPAVWPDQRPALT